MPFKDPARRREYRREWYFKNKESEKNHIKRRKNKIRAWFKKYKKSLKCSNCNENHPATIEFHHKKGIKDRAICKMVDDGLSIKRILSEINKCEVLCSNCHKKKHYQNNNL